MLVHNTVSNFNGHVSEDIRIKVKLVGTESQHDFSKDEVDNPA